MHSTVRQDTARASFRNTSDLSPLSVTPLTYIPSFTVIPDTLKWVSNHERTRWFLVLHVARPVSDGLNRLLALSNRALAAFNQPSLYASSRGARRNRAPVAHGRGQDLSESSGDYSDCFHIS